MELVVGETQGCFKVILIPQKKDLMYVNILAMANLGQGKHVCLYGILSQPLVLNFKSLACEHIL